MTKVTLTQGIRHVMVAGRSWAFEKGKTRQDLPLEVIVACGKINAKSGKDLFRIEEVQEATVVPVKQKKGKRMAEPVEAETPAPPPPSPDESEIDESPLRFVDDVMTRFEQPGVI